jgi:ATP-binding cassette subfamily B protein
VKLAGMMVVGIPLVLLPVLLFGRKVRGFSRRSQDRIADVGTLATETLGAMKIVQASTRKAARRRASARQSRRCSRRPSAGSGCAR